MVFYFVFIFRSRLLGMPRDMFFVANFALKQLSVAQIAKIKAYNQALHFGYQPKSLQQAAAWLDWVHCHQEACRDFKYYHYIDYPYSIDGTPYVEPYKVNALTAIARAVYVLKRSDVSAAEKGLQLRILMHVVADIHQPMHAISLFSHRFLHGDRGGNSYTLGSNRVAKNLHAYWDRGGGYLKRHKLYSAKKINKKYHIVNTSCLNKSMDPRVWSQESHQIAKNLAYKIGYLQKPSKQYQHMVNKISKERLNLAACRLGVLLKEIIL